VKVRRVAVTISAHHSEDKDPSKALARIYGEFAEILSLLLTPHMLMLPQWEIILKLGFPVLGISVPA